MGVFCVLIFCQDALSSSSIEAPELLGFNGVFRQYTAAVVRGPIQSSVVMVVACRCSRL